MVFSSAVFHSLSDSGLKTAVSAMLFTIGLYMFIGKACGVYTHCVGVCAETMGQWVLYN